MTISRSRSFVIALAALAVVSLAACAESTPAAEPSSSSTPAATPTPEPTQPALAELVLSPAGLGPLVVGAPVPVEDETVAVVRYDPEGCVSDSGEVRAGIWRPAYTEERPFDVVTAELAQDGAIDRILVLQPFVRTAEGIGIGSTLDELRAAYPAIVGVDDGLTSLYTLETDEGTLTFEVASERATPGYWTPEQQNTVMLVAARAPGDPVRGIYATDGYNSCPV